MRRWSEAKSPDLQVRPDSPAALRFRCPMRSRKGLPKWQMRVRTGATRVHYRCAMWSREGLPGREVCSRSDGRTM